ncbi:MAG TPA: hypothetical protein PL041_01165 [Melioribacteraceae bacterium]|nr:hypothetical protein [Melioribacteraceae bacterium]
MKNLLIKLSVIFILIFVLLGCEENFSPKTEKKDAIFLYAFIKANDAPPPAPAVKQVVVITKVYDVEGFDPMINNVDPTIKNAVVTLTVSNRANNLTLDSVASDYQNRRQQYFYSGYVGVQSYDSIIIAAKLSNGKTLSGKTRTPKYLNFEFSYPYNHGFTTNLNQVIPVNSWTVTWFNNNPMHLLFPRLLIKYKQNLGSSTVTKSIIVPNSLINRNGIKEPIYTEYFKANGITYNFDAVDYAMAKLSEGNPNKSDYTLMGLYFDIVELDLPLTNYYSATNGYLDAYSIRADANIYTNISGGYGVFGAMFTSSFYKELDINYVESFGYQKL